MTNNHKSITLVLGGTRSGKTAYAEDRARTLSSRGQKPIYVATGQAFDDEMKARIARHRSLREGHFGTIEEPLDLAGVLARHKEGDVLLIDSLGTWITNHMMAEHDLDAVIDTLMAALDAAAASVVIVSDEVGMGIVPENTLSRRFRDHIGMANQHVGKMADTVAFLVAGIPMMIKNNSNSYSEN